MNRESRYNIYNKKRLIIVGMIISLFLFDFFTLITSANELPKEWQEDLRLYATAAVLMDADSGRILYYKNGDEFMANASTTKIMTCILALEYAMLEDQVEVSTYATSMPEVKMYIKNGESYSMNDLLHALMLESYNDVAVAIAEHIGAKALKLPKASERTKEESREAVAIFATMMNEKARKIGCENTNFITPNGLDETIIKEDGTEVYHGTTASDLARIMAYCMNQSPYKEEFLDITQAPNYLVTNQTGGRSFSCVNHNAFLNMMEGAVTGKTGFTNKAGYCYVGGFQRDGKSFTIALLACGWPSNKSYKWSDAKKLYTYGLEEFSYHTFEEVKFDDSKLTFLDVLEGQTEEIGDVSKVKLKVVEGEDAPIGLLLHSEEKIEVDFELLTQIKAPIEEGIELGRISYRVDDCIYKQDKIIGENEVLKIDYKWCFLQIIKKFLL